jgi:hypothetical protein
MGSATAVERPDEIADEDARSEHMRRSGARVRVELAVDELPGHVRGQRLEVGVRRLRPDVLDHETTVARTARLFDTGR